MTDPTTYVPTLAELADLLAETATDYRNQGTHQSAADALLDCRATVQSMQRRPATYDVAEIHTRGYRIGDVVGWHAPGTDGYGYAWVVIGRTWHPADPADTDEGHTAGSLGWWRYEISNPNGNRVADVEHVRLTLAERPNYLRQ